MTYKKDSFLNFLENELVEGFDAEYILLKKAEELIWQKKASNGSIDTDIENAIMYLRAVLLLNMYNRNARELLFNLFLQIWNRIYRDSKLIGVAYLMIENNLLLIFNEQIRSDKNTYSYRKLVGPDKFEQEADLIYQEDQNKYKIEGGVLHFPKDNVFIFQRPDKSFLSILSQKRKLRIGFEDEYGDEIIHHSAQIGKATDFDFKIILKEVA